MAKLGEYNASQHAAGLAVTSKLIEFMHVLSMVSTVKVPVPPEMKCVKENDQIKKEAKEEGTWVEQKRPPAPPRGALVTTTGREPELPEPDPSEFRGLLKKQNFSVNRITIYNINLMVPLLNDT
jgi:large subunit ribosomal protein L21e